MFVSADFLSINYGVDDKIAKFFVDREPPVDNLYWNKKLLYLRPAPGYLFIPLIVDLLHRIGIEKARLLSEDFVTTMEQIGHISALEETKQITQVEAVDMCIRLVNGNCKNKDWLHELIGYFRDGSINTFSSLATQYPALHRGDVFLFSVCALDFDLEQKEKIIEQWFALISTLLLIDDAEDLKDDILTSEENAFLEGKKGEGIEALHILLENNIAKISKYNRAMSIQLHKQYKETTEQPHILQLINQL